MIRHLRPLIAIAILTSCDSGSGYDVVVVNGPAMIVVAKPSLNRDGLLAVAKDACGARKDCQVRVWTDSAWAPKDTSWPPGSREMVSLIYNRWQDSGEVYRWNCRRYPDVAAADCIPF